MGLLNNIAGYSHGNRGVGIRDHQLILPSVICSTHVARRIAKELSAVTFAHQHGCGIIGEDVAGIDDFFAELADHLNISSVLIVSLGCETIQGQELGARLVARNASTRYQIIQESGGVEGTITSGVASARKLSQDFPKTSASIDSLRIGFDNSRNFDEANNWIEALERDGAEIIKSQNHRSSTESFAELMTKKVHLVISFPDDLQPASGFPLFPVLNVQGNSSLHNAISKDFDLHENSSTRAVIEMVGSIANGALTIAEATNSGEIRAPRIVRSV
jgi:altronate dehydratase